DDVTLAEFTAVQADLGDAVYHQHGRRRQLCIARAEIAAFARFEQIFLCVGRLRSVKVSWVGQDKLLRRLAGGCAASGDFVATVFFDAGASSQAQGSSHEGPNFIPEFLRIGSLFAHLHSDHRLANSADHQRNGEMWIDVMGNKAVTLRRLEHERAAGELFVGESPFDIQNFGRAAQSADDEGSEGVVVVEGDIAGYSPSLSVRPAF